MTIATLREIANAFERQFPNILRRPNVIGVSAAESPSNGRVTVTIRLDAGDPDASDIPDQFKWGDRTVFVQTEIGPMVR